jgi:hypothetical protein
MALKCGPETLVQLHGIFWYRKKLPLGSLGHSPWRVATSAMIN